MKRLGVAVAVVLAVAALAWNAGELHRRNCVSEGRAACSVLPWDNGHLTRQQQLERKYGVDKGWG